MGGVFHDQISLLCVYEEFFCSILMEDGPSHPALLSLLGRLPEGLRARATFSHNGYFLGCKFILHVIFFFRTSYKCRLLIVQNVFSKF